MAERNVELLEATLQFIKDNPDKHNQNMWCGTAQCFAGWAIALKGWERYTDDLPMVQREGLALRIPTAAKNELGLSEYEALILFDGSNTVDMLELMVKDLVNGAPLRATYEYRKEAEGETAP